VHYPGRRVHQSDCAQDNHGQDREIITKSRRLEGSDVQDLLVVSRDIVRRSTLGLRAVCGGDRPAGTEVR
jgi:hypothetical protein